MQRARLLKVLGSFDDTQAFGSMVDAAGFAFVISQMGVEDRIEALLWRRAFLCRFMHQPLSEIEGRTSEELQRYVRLIGEMLKVTAPMAALAEMG